MAERDPLARYAVLVRLFDEVFRIPGTKWRFGLDSILGLIPGVGDAAGALVGMYGLMIARQLGAPTSVQGRMLMNIAIDAVVGVIPFVGDLFDFAFKAHVRNRVLLEQWLQRPAPVRRRSRLALIGIPVAVMTIVIATLWFAVWCIRQLVLYLSGS